MSITSIEHEGKTYALHMTRAGIRAAEAQGLSSSQIADKPFTALTLLVFAALYSAYKLNLNKVEKIMDDVLEPAGTVSFSDLLTELSEAYVELFGSGGPE